MFGRKKSAIELQPTGAVASPATFIVMPDIFYGGQDPELYHPGSASHAAAPSAAAGNRSARPSALALVSRRRWIGIGGVFMLMVAGISWYYFRSASRPSELTPAASAPIGALPSESPLSDTAATSSGMAFEEQPTATSSVSSDIAEPPSLRTPSLALPAFGLPASADLDADSLTDAEEEMFHTESGVWDTDGDGYFDGLEAVNLYSPQGISPMKLVDSGLIQEYINPRWQYRVYRLGDWEVGTVDPGANEVLVSAISGDFFVMRASPKEPNESFPSWFARVTPQESFSDLLQSRNRFDVPVWLRRDREVAYIPSDTAIFVLHYGARDGQRELSYPHVLEMMVQSFRVAETSVELPEQRPLPPSP